MFDAQMLWFASRGTGVVAFLLLSAVMVLGILTAGKFAPVRLPAMVKVGLHRNLSLLMTVFVAVHAVTAIADGFVNIGWLALVVPFTSEYETLGVALASIAVDITLTLIVTGLLRDRLPAKAWQAIHLFAYLMWPLSVVHTYLLAGVDKAWMWPLTTAITVVTLAFGVWRAVIALRDRGTRVRLAAAFRAPVTGVAQPEQKAHLDA